MYMYILYSYMCIVLYSMMVHVHVYTMEVLMDVRRASIFVLSSTLALSLLPDRGDKNWTWTNDYINQSLDHSMQKASAILICDEPRDTREDGWTQKGPTRKWSFPCFQQSFSPTTLFQRFEIVIECIADHTRYWSRDEHTGKRRHTT